MKLINSVCTNLFFPSSRKSFDAFSEMAVFLRGMGMDCVEFYHDGEEKSKIGSVLARNGLNGVYIAVIPHKEGLFHLCDEDEEKRVIAVKKAKSFIDDANGSGLRDIMFNSGKIGVSVEAGLKALGQSFEDLFEYVAKKGYQTRILLEPCDSAMDACQLLGPYERALAFIKHMHESGMPVMLTMDSAHTAEEGQDFFKAVSAVKSYCDHIHFANCNISDPSYELYGDKHLGFEYPSTVWTPETLAELTGRLSDLYQGQDLRIGLEVLCREDDPFKYFEKTWESLPFLHK